MRSKSSPLQTESRKRKKSKPKTLLAASKANSKTNDVPYQLLFQEHYRQSLYHTTKYLCGYRDINRHAHGEIIGALEDPSKRKVICVPRGSFKSSICCVAYPLWRLINNPNERVLIDSELYSNSTTFMREIKSIVLSDHFIDIFGQWKGDIWKEDEVLFNTRTEKYKEASITCSGIGAVKVGQHYSVAVGDDYNSNKNSLTPENRKKVIDHYKYNVSILDPGGTYVLVGTRYSTDDLIGHVLKNELGEEQKLLLPKGAL